MSSQVKHEWIDWYDFSEAHIRLFRDSDILPLHKSHQIIRTMATNGRKTVEYNHLVEFEEPLPASLYARNKVALSMTREALTRLRFWKLAAGGIVMERTAELVEWLRGNLEHPTKGVLGAKYIYVTSDSEDDMTLVRLRGNPIS